MMYKHHVSIYNIFLTISASSRGVRTNLLLKVLFIKEYKRLTGGIVRDY